MPNAPAAWCAHSGSLSLHTSIHSGGTGNIRHSPRSSLRLIPRSPRGPIAFLTPSSGRRFRVSSNLTPAKGRQNHTASPSASRPRSSVALLASTAPRPTFRDDLAVTPLCPGRDAQRKTHVSEKRKQNIFHGRAGQEFAGRARRANHLMCNEREQAAAQRFLEPAPVVRSKPNWLMERFHFSFTRAVADRRRPEAHSRSRE